MLGEIIDQLRAKAMPALTSVDGAEEMAALGKQIRPKHGAAFVTPFEERASDNVLITGSFRQAVEVFFLVVVVLRKSDDLRGASRIQAADIFARAIESALAGWCWNETAEPAQFVAGRAAAADQGVTLYAQTWRTSRWIET